MTLKTKNENTMLKTEPHVAVLTRLLRTQRPIRPDPATTAHFHVGRTVNACCQITSTIPSVKLIYHLGRR